MASNAAGSVQGAASSAADSVQSAASTAVGAVQQAPDAVIRQTQGNPLAAGLIAFGVGWLVSSLLPASEKEKQLAQQAETAVKEHKDALLEPAKQAAQEIGEQLKPAAQQAVESVKSTAQDAATTVDRGGQVRCPDVQGQAQQSKDTVQSQAPAPDPPGSPDPPLTHRAPPGSPGGAQCCPRRRLTHGVRRGPRPCRAPPGGRCPAGDDAVRLPRSRLTDRRPRGRDRDRLVPWRRPRPSACSSPTTRTTSAPSCASPSRGPGARSPPSVADGDRRAGRRPRRGPRPRRPRRVHARRDRARGVQPRCGPDPATAGIRILLLSARARPSDDVARGLAPAPTPTWPSPSAWPRLRAARSGPSPGGAAAA